MQQYLDGGQGHSGPHQRWPAGLKNPSLVATDRLDCGAQNARVVQRCGAIKWEEERVQYVRVGWRNEKADGGGAKTAHLQQMPLTNRAYDTKSCLEHVCGIIFATTAHLELKKHT